jgi:hypothetical protein
MGLLDRLRGWIRELFGATESDTDSADSSNEPDEAQLDPDNVTEVRTEATDSSVAKLQDLKQSQDDATDDQQ